MAQNKDFLSKGVLITSEYVHYFVLLTTLSVVPLFLAKSDSSGFLLSASSVMANLLVMIFLPIVARWSNGLNNYCNLLAVRFVTLISLSMLLILQSWWALLLVQALTLIALSFQQVNSNRSFQDLGFSLPERSVFKFELGTAVVGFAVALAMYLVLDWQEVSPLPLFTFLMVCLLANLLILMIFNNLLRSAKTSLKRAKGGTSVEVPFACKLVFCRSQVSFLAQRLLWFIVPLWFAKTGNVKGFVYWLLISSSGILVALLFVQIKTQCRLNLKHLFLISNLGLIVSIGLIVVMPSDMTMYLAGVVCTFSIPIQRTYTRQLASHVQSTRYSAAELIAHGSRLIRFIHLALVLLFPLTLQFGGLAITAAFSLAVIMLVAMSDKFVSTNEQTIIRS